MARGDFSKYFPQEEMVPGERQGVNPYTDNIVIPTKEGAWRNPERGISKELIARSFG
jgi:hypothetical protein